MPKALGICGIYREDQFSSGVYAVVENLLRGMAEVQREPGDLGDFDLTVFHGACGLKWKSDAFTYKQVCGHGGRYPGETRVGLYDSAGLDAVLFPNFYTPPIVRARRAVCTIHDLQYLHLPEHWPLGKRIWNRVTHEITLRKCDAVIAISQTVKDDILNQYGSRWASKVHAVWNPVSIDRFDGPDEHSFANGRPYILCAAVDRPAKNLATLIRAYSILKQRRPEFCLVLAGQLRSADLSWRKTSGSVKDKLPAAGDLVAELGLTNDVVVTGFISNEQLGALYRGASLFALPSLFEGFGMPAVEAMALGAPTLVSDLPVLREVTLNRAQYLEHPRDEHELSERMLEILDAGAVARPAPELRQEIRERFAPATIARQYLSILLNRPFAQQTKPPPK
jgi:glycosyltransferase involved in cell wall biosynthesis